VTNNPGCKEDTNYCEGEREKIFEAVDTADGACERRNILLL
jgi:hypothetical protein